MTPTTTRPKRKTVPHGEYRVSIELVDVRGDVLIETYDRPLQFADSWLNEHWEDAGRILGGAMDDLGQRRARQLSAQRKAKKK